MLLLLDTVSKLLIVILPPLAVDIVNADGSDKLKVLADAPDDEKVMVWELLALMLKFPKEARDIVVLLPDGDSIRRFDPLGAEMAMVVLNALLVKLVPPAFRRYRFGVIILSRLSPDETVSPLLI